MKTSILASVVLMTLGAAGIGKANAQANADIGTIWNEQEAGWQGVWTRVGKSEKFQAVWTKGSNVVRANLQVQVSGDSVFVFRDDTAGPGVGKGGCKYNGKITGNAVTGQYTCQWSKGWLPWKATISR